MSDSEKTVPPHSDDPQLSEDPAPELPPPPAGTARLAGESVFSDPIPPVPPAAPLGASMAAQPAPVAEPVATTPGVHYGRLAWGSVLLALGAVFLLERFDLFFLDDYVRYWPLLVVAVVLSGLGVVSLVTARGREARRAGLWLLGLGGWFLLNALEPFGLWFNDTWPLLILLGGVVELVLPKAGKGRLAALWPLAIGFWLLINTLGWWGFYWSDSWPWLLILLGAVLIVQATLGKPGTERRQGRI